MDRMISDEEVVEIGRKLRELREKLGYTQQEFADELYWMYPHIRKSKGEKLL